MKTASGALYNNIRKTDKTTNRSCDGIGVSLSHLKVGRVFADVTECWRAFQARAAATGNARSPSVERRVAGTICCDPVIQLVCKYNIIIIIIMWLVQSWTLPFLRACSMPVDSALGGRRLLAQCWMVQGQIRRSEARWDNITWREWLAWRNWQKTTKGQKVTCDTYNVMYYGNSRVVSGDIWWKWSFIYNIESSVMGNINTCVEEVYILSFHMNVVAAIVLSAVQL